MQLISWSLEFGTAVALNKRFSFLESLCELPADIRVQGAAIFPYQERSYGVPALQRIQILPESHRLNQRTHGTGELSILELVVEPYISVVTVNTFLYI